MSHLRFKLLGGFAALLTLGAIAAPTAGATRPPVLSHHANVNATKGHVLRGLSLSRRAKAPTLVSNRLSDQAIRAWRAFWYAVNPPGTQHQAPGGGTVGSPGGPAPVGGQQPDYGRGNAPPHP